MKITVKSISELYPAEKNIRNHTAKQIEEYKKSIKMFGQIRPLIVDENGEIIAGNGLYIAMKDMERETAECYVMTGLSKKQKTKLMMADNKIYELGTTNTHVLEDIVIDLEKDFDVPGWDPEILSILDATQQDIDNMVDDLNIDAPPVNELSSEKRETVKDIQSGSEENTYTEGWQEKPKAPAEVKVERTEKYVICPRCGEKICL